MDKSFLYHKPFNSVKKLKVLSNSNCNCMANLFLLWGSSEGWEWPLTFWDETFDTRRPPRQCPGPFVVVVVVVVVYQ